MRDEARHKLVQRSPIGKVIASPQTEAGTANVSMTEGKFASNYLRILPSVEISVYSWTFIQSCVIIEKRR